MVIINNSRPLYTSTVAKFDLDIILLPNTLWYLISGATLY